MKKPLMTVGMVEETGVKDRCVVCDCETPFDINEHIDFTACSKIEQII